MDYKKLCVKQSFLIKEFALGEKRCLYIYTLDGEDWDKVCGIRCTWEELYRRLYDRFVKDNIIK